jgi:hypothetical protein
MCTKFGLKSLKGRHLSEDLGVNGKIILKLILTNEGVRICTGFIWLRIRPMAGPCEYGNI